MEQEFINLVEEKNIKGLRNYIAVWLILNPTFQDNKCDVYMRYLNEKGIDITEPY